MAATLRNALSTGLINRYGERDRFDAFCRTLDAAVLEGTEVKFMIDVHATLDTPVKGSVAEILRNWIDSVCATADKYEVDAGEFVENWKAVSAMYDSLPDMAADYDPVKVAGAALGVKFADPEVKKAEEHAMQDAKIVEAADRSLKERMAEGGINYMNKQFMEQNRSVSVMEYLEESIADKDVLSKLHMEFERFAKGPEAAVVGNNPMSVEHFDSAKRQLSANLPVIFWHVSDALRQVDWTHSIMGENYWQQQIQRYNSVR